MIRTIFLICILKERRYRFAHNNSISFYLSGRFALFSDPITRVGGEKFSYPVPTYQALKGIFESVYWKPTFIWYPDAIRVMNPIETQSRVFVLFDITMEQMTFLFIPIW